MRNKSSKNITYIQAWLYFTSNLQSSSKADIFEKRKKMINNKITLLSNNYYLMLNVMFHYILDIYSMLPCVSSVIDHRWRSNVVKTKKWHTSCRREYHWRCFYHILMSSVVYYWTDPRQLGIYLFYTIQSEKKKDRYTYRIYSNQRPTSN